MPGVERMNPPQRVWRRGYPADSARGSKHQTQPGHPPTLPLAQHPALRPDNNQMAHAWPSNFVYTLLIN
jgi:hypothetical protein